MTLETVRAALLSVSQNSHHAVAPTGTQAPYVVWMEDGARTSLYAEGRLQKQVIEGTIDLFDDAEYSLLFGSVQKALGDAGIPFRLNYINFETDTRLFHYEWVFTVVMEPHDE